MAEKPSVTLSLVASADTRIGKVEILVNNEAERKVQHLRFSEAFTPNGSMLSVSVSEFEKAAEALVDARPERVLNGLKRSKFNSAFVGPKLNDGETIEAFVQSECEKLLEFCAANKPETTSGPVLRKVNDVMVKLLAQLMLVSAETSGEIPESLDLDKLMEAANIKAKNMAAEFGKDTLGQFRIQKAKVKKAGEATAEVTSEEEMGEEA